MIVDGDMMMGCKFNPVFKSETANYARWLVLGLPDSLFHC